MSCIYVYYVIIKYNYYLLVIILFMYDVPIYILYFILLTHNNILIYGYSL